MGIALRASDNMTLCSSEASAALEREIDTGSPRALTLFTGLALDEPLGTPRVIGDGLFGTSITLDALFRDQRFFSALR